MIRARRTAELAGLPDPRVTPELREWDYGGYEGITTPAIRRTRPFWNLWTDGVDPGSDEHPGESPGQIGQRADQSSRASGPPPTESGARTPCSSRTRTSCASSPPATSA